MSANNELPHVVVIPEDKANRAIANGFALECVFIKPRQFHIDPNANGWHETYRDFNRNHANMMTTKYLDRHVILLLDFDRRPGEQRLQAVLEKVPAALRSRVFIIGTKIDPEHLKADLAKSLEAIGKDLANACRNQVEFADTIWSHFETPGEVQRMCQSLRKLFIRT